MSPREAAPDHPVRDPSEPRWYACYTRARHEKKASLLLQERSIESFLPVVSRIRQWKDRTKVVSFVMFPSYVFARFALDDLGRVLSTPGIALIVRNNGRAVAIPDEEIENVRLLADAFGRSELEPETVAFPEEGDRVRISAGPFRGVEGIVIERRGVRRVLVGLPVIGQAVPVHVDPRDLEILAA